MMKGLPFSKMHGLGNDMVVLDMRSDNREIKPEQFRKMADRHFGIGCDQFMILHQPSNAHCLAAYSIVNHDGSAAKQCGNGVRCVVAWLKRNNEIQASQVCLEGPAGDIQAELIENGLIRVNMGEPNFDPQASGFLAKSMAQRYLLTVAQAEFSVGVVAVGNPHAMLEVLEVAKAPVATLGPAIQQHPMFEHGCNVGFAERVSTTAIKLRVYERGAKETLACGSAACAAVAIMRQRGKVDAKVSVKLPGGLLLIEWQGEGHPIWMSGPAAFVYEGVWQS